MVKYSDPIDRVFFALSDSIRRQILKKISEKKTTVSVLAEPFAISLPAISKHLKVLEIAGLIKRKKNGRQVSFILKKEPFMTALERLEVFEKYWAEELTKLPKGGD